MDLSLTELWHVLYQLPLIPIHANPHFYLALVMLCSPGSVPQPRADAYFQSCVGHDTYYRFPDGRGGNFSHDEILGAASYSQIAAAELYDTLETNDGIFPDEFGHLVATRYFYRYVFLKPYLRARLGMPVSAFAQSFWSMHVVWSIFMNRQNNFDPDGLLKVWVMGQSVKNYPEMNFFYELWKKVMKSRGIGPKMIFAGHYLTECPSMARIAPDDFN
jgi:hypothetical protein